MKVFIYPSEGMRSLRGSGMRYVTWLLIGVLFLSLSVMAQQVRKDRRPRDRSGRKGVPSNLQQKWVSVGPGLKALRTQWTNQPVPFAVASWADMKKYPLLPRSSPIPKMRPPLTGGGQSHSGIRSQKQASSRRFAPTNFRLPTVGRNFQGIVQRRGIVPPDTMGAAGPTYLVEFTNDDVGIFTKSGTKVQQVALEQFFGALGPTFIFDPRVLYDQYSGRFIALALDGFASPNSWIFLAVSQSSDPTGNWFFYKIDADRDGNTQTDQWADFTDLGVDQDAVYMAGNMFPTSGSAQYSKVWCVPKQQLLIGQQNINFTEFSQLTSVFTFRAAHSFGSAPAEYLVSFWFPSDAIQVWRITNPLTNATLTQVGNISVPSVGFPPVPMPNNFDFLNDYRLLNAVYQNGSVWTAHSVDTGDGKSSVRWYELDVIGLQARQVGTIDQPAAQWWYYPSVAVNSLGDMVMSLSGSSSNDFPGVYVTAHLHTDPPGFTQPVTLVKAGEGASFSGRWGDYAAAALDPADPNQRTFWILNEYALSGGNWATWWGEAILPDLANPDVIVQSVSVTPNNSARGISLTATVVVQNTGKTFTNDFAVDFYRHRSTAPSPGVAGDLRQTVTGGLTLGGTRTLTFNFTPPTLGDFNAWVQVDTLNQVSEGDENNNVSGPTPYKVFDAIVYDTFTGADGTDARTHVPNVNLPLDRWRVFTPAPPPLPATPVFIQNNELRVTPMVRTDITRPPFVSATLDGGTSDGFIDAEMRVSTNAFRYGGIIFRQSDSSNFFVVRIDSSAADGEQLALMKVQGSNVPLGTYLARRKFTTQAGATYQWHIELVKSKISVFVDGVKYIEAIDSFNQNATHAGVLWYPSFSILGGFIITGGEDTAYDNFAVYTDKPTQPTLSDLAVQSVSISPTASVPGTPLTATIVVKNNGTAANSAFNVDFYENLSSAPNPGQVGSKRFSVPALGQGATTTLTYTFTPSNPGNYQAWVQVDTENQVTEGNETNNVTGPSAYIVANALVQDTFSDTDGKVLGPGASDHLPDVSPSGERWNWTGTVTPIVQTGEAALSGSGSGLVTAFINSGTANGAIDADTRVVSSSLLFSGIVFRRSDANNYFYARADSSDMGKELGIARVQNGVTTFLGKVPFTLTSGKTYHWRIELSGAVIRVFFDGVQQFEVNDSFNQAATQCGLLWNPSAGGQNTTFDNFLVTGTPQPDVTIQSFTISPLIAPPNTNLTATVVVKNQGSAAAGAFVVDFYKHSTTQPGAVPGDLRQTVNALSAGATATLTFNFSQSAEATYQAWAQVDTDGALTELNETNNVAGPLNYTTVNTIAENVKDTFTDANGTFLNQHTPDVNKPGGSWSVTGPVSAAVQNNQAKTAGTAAGFVLATINGGAANCTIDVDTTFGSTGLLYSGVVFRASNPTNYFIARADSSDKNGELALVRVQNGVGTYLTRTARSLTPGSTVHWRITLSSGSIQVFFDNMLTPVFSVTDNFNKSATMHGLQWFASNGGENTAYDNFAVTPASNPNAPTGRGRRFSPGLYLLSLPMSAQLSSGVKLARWNNLSGTVEPSETPGTRSGEGYWAQFDRETVLTAPASASSQPFTFSLAAGWNLIGYPFLTPMALDWNGITVRDVTTGVVTTWADAVQRGWLDEVMWTYQNADGYRPVHPTLSGALNTLEPWQGYYVKATQPLQLTLPAPDNVPTVKRSNVRAASLSNWSLTLTVRDGSGQDSCVLGVSNGAGGDGVALKPPPAPSPAPSVAFPSGGQTPYAVNLRQSMNSRAEWDVEVTPSPNSATVTLDWSNLTSVPKNVRLTLVDVETGKRYYMRTQSGLTVPSHGASPRRFQLIASTDVSGRRLLSALNATGGRSSGPVLVSFVLGSQADVTLEVLSPTGKVVSRPLGATHRSAGLNTLTWDGKDPRGRVIPRGVYLLRVTAIDDEGRTMSLTQPVTLGK